MAGHGGKPLILASTMSLRSYFASGTAVFAFFEVAIEERSGQRAVASEGDECQPLCFPCLFAAACGAVWSRVALHHLLAAPRCPRPACPTRAAPALRWSPTPKRAAAPVLVAGAGRGGRYECACQQGQTRCAGATPGSNGTHVCWLPPPTIKAPPRRRRHPAQCRIKSW